MGIVEEMWFDSQLSTASLKINWPRSETNHLPSYIAMSKNGEDVLPLPNTSSWHGY
jgi:hypothetical protein